MNKFKHYLNLVFPFLSAIVLWRLDSAVFNPCGILAILPVFYYSFIRPRDYFWFFAVIMCFLIDANFDTLLFWTTSFALMYAANGFQTYIDLSRQKFDGVYIFMVFFGICMLILGIWAVISTGHFGLMLNAGWIFAQVSVLYVPFVALAKAIGDD